MYDTLKDLLAQGQVIMTDIEDLERERQADMAEEAQDEAEGDIKYWKRAADDEHFCDDKLEILRSQLADLERKIGYTRWKMNQEAQSLDDQARDMVAEAHQHDPEREADARREAADLEFQADQERTQSQIAA